MPENLIKRDEVEVGFLIIATTYEANGKKTLSSYRNIGSILFTRAPENSTEGINLLDTEKTYLIVNNSIEHVEKLKDGDIVIYEPLKLGALLKEAGYQEILSYSDLRDIINIIFSGSYASENSTTFGYNKTSLDFLDKIIDNLPIPIRKLIRKIYGNGHCWFTLTEENELTHLFNIDSYGSKPLTELINVLYGYPKPNLRPFNRVLKKKKSKIS